MENDGRSGAAAHEGGLLLELGAEDDGRFPRRDGVPGRVQGYDGRRQGHGQILVAGLVLLVLLVRQIEQALDTSCRVHLMNYRVLKSYYDESEYNYNDITNLL